MLIKFDATITTVEKTGNRFLRGMFVDGPDAGTRLQVWESDTRDIETLEGQIIEGDLDLVELLKTVGDDDRENTFWKVSNIDVTKRLKGDEAKAVRALVNEATRKNAEARGARPVGKNRPGLVAAVSQTAVTEEEPDLTRR